MVAFICIHPPPTPICRLAVAEYLVKEANAPLFAQNAMMQTPLQAARFFNNLPDDTDVAKFLWAAEVRAKTPAGYAKDKPPEQAS